MFAIRRDEQCDIEQVALSKSKTWASIARERMFECVVAQCFGKYIRFLATGRWLAFKLSC